LKKFSEKEYQSTRLSILLKKSCGTCTDLSENNILEFALQNNLFDVKVCAVSEAWSGLKLVVPLAER